MNKIFPDENKHIKPFLFPHGNLSSDSSQTKLTNANISLDEILVYETLPNPKLKEELDAETNSFKSVPEFVVFFSPSGVRNTVKYFDNHSTEIKVRAMDKIIHDFYTPVEKNLRKILQFIAIGPTTQKAMQDMGIKVYGAAKKPTPEDLLNILE